MPTPGSNANVANAYADANSSTTMNGSLAQATPTWTLSALLISLRGYAMVGLAIAVWRVKNGKSRLEPLASFAAAGVAF